MSWRTVVLSNRAKVSYSMGYMIIRDQDVHKIFMDEIGTVIIGSTAVSLTAVWLNECFHRKIRVIFCDEKGNPEGEAAPYWSSFDSSRKIRNQIQWQPSIKSLVWQQIVIAKIRKQEEVLRKMDLCEAADLLSSYVPQVEPSDCSNREGHAAKVYFNALWGKDFSRRNECVENDAMNYGYAIILSACNREVASSGYLSQLGIFHDNVFNPFNLGCDLMEPFRPLIDWKVIQMRPEKLERDEKLKLVDTLNDKVRISDRITTVSQAIGTFCRSVFAALEEQKVELIRTYELIYGK